MSNVLKTAKKELTKKFSKKPLASTPIDFSFSNWKAALMETKTAMKNKKLGIMAAGVGFYATLAFFPFMVAAVAIATLLMSPEQVQNVSQSVSALLPKDMASLVSSQLESALNNRKGSIAAAIIAIGISLFSVSGAVQNLISATSTVFDTKETRGIIKLRLLSLLMTVGLIIFGFLVIATLLINGSALQAVNAPQFIINLMPYVRWPILILLMTVALAALYRYAPDRKNARWQWVSWGALIATILWLILTVAFFIYSQNFANFSETYSLFAGIIVLMLWLNYSALTFLIGGEINHHLETKTSLKTTTKKLFK